jgi:hypothetical protein
MKSQDEELAGTANALRQLSVRDDLVREHDEHTANTLMASAFKEGGADFPRWKVEIMVEGINHLYQGRCDLEGMHKRSMAKARKASRGMLELILAEQPQEAPEHA